MILNRRSKLGLCVLGASIVWLVFDQFVAPAPEPALAEAVARPESGQAMPERRGARRRGNDDEKWLVSFLESLHSTSQATSKPADLTAIRDPFLGNLLDASGGGAGNTLGGGRMSSIAQFKESHKLQATILGPHPMALLDKRTLRVGDVVDGFTLDRVENGWVEFVSGRDRMRLDVPSARRP